LTELLALSKTEVETKAKDLGLDVTGLVKVDIVQKIYDSYQIQPAATATAVDTVSEGNDKIALEIAKLKIEAEREV
jgi:hypothetical protein